MASWILAIAAALRAPVAWVASQLDVRNRLHEQRLADERFRDCSYRLVSESTELVATLRSGLTVDHLPSAILLERLNTDLQYIQREGINEVYTRCRTATHPAAEDVVNAASQLENAMNDLVAHAPLSGGAPTIRRTPIDDTYMRAIEDAADLLSVTNTAFIFSARKDLR